MSMKRMLEILDRTRNGPLCSEKEWLNRVVPRKIAQKLKEHNLQGTFDRENPINTDDSVADEFFKAGFELAIDAGLLCHDTERIVNVTEDELKEAIRNAPSEVTMGRGQDRVTQKHRQPEDKHPPTCNAPLQLVISEDIWVPLMQAIVENRDIDIFQGGSLATIYGHPVMSGTPYETLLGRYQPQLAREALWRAGRTGMPAPTIGGTTEYGILGGLGIPGGVDPDDGTGTLTPGELLVTYMSLHRVAKAINCGANKITGSITSMIGGHAGSPEGAAVAQIAAGLLTHLVYQATISSTSLYDARYGGASGREGQWAVSIILQAFARNTHVLKYSLANQVAGPCTEMLLYESVVAMMNASASGASETTFPRSGGGKYTDWLTPLECKLCAEVTKKSAGMSRKKANEIAKVLIPKYEDMLFNPPKGKGTRECYDLKEFKPTQEWLDIYLKVKKEVIELGVPLEYP